MLCALPQTGGGARGAGQGHARLALAGSIPARKTFRTHSRSGHRCPDLECEPCLVGGDCHTFAFYFDRRPQRCGKPALAVQFLLGLQEASGFGARSTVGPRLGKMFEDAFSQKGTSAGRPVARDWVAALAELEANLKQCSANSSHWSLGSSPCPWCKMEGATGVPLFSTVVPASGATLFDIAGFQRRWTPSRIPGRCRPSPRRM